MKKTVTIVTSNKGKIHSLTHALEGLDVQVESVNLNLLEPQYNTIEDVAKYKAKEAFKQLKKPLIVHDGGLVVPALNGFPGVYTKYVSETLTPQDFVNLMKDKQDKTCYLTQSMIYVDEKGELHQFQDKLMGKIADTVSTVDNDKGWGMLWQVFVPKGADKPLAEIPEDMFDNEIRPLAKTNSVWEDFKSFLIKVYNIPTPEVKKTQEVMPKKVEKPIIPTPNKEVAPLKKEELSTDKGQGLEDVHSPKTSENKAQTQENGAFEKWLDELGELVESRNSKEIQKMLSCVYRDEAGFVFDNKFSGEKFYFSKEGINKQNKFGHTLAMILLQYAPDCSYRGAISLTDVDLLTGVDCQKKDKDGRTVLHYYCQNKYVKYDVLEYMVQNEYFDFYERDAFKMSPLLYLFSNDLFNLECIEWMFMDSELLQNNFSKALDQEENNFLITLLEKYNWKSKKSVKSNKAEDDDEYDDEDEEDDEYEMDLIEEVAQRIVIEVPDLSGVKSKDGLSLLQYIKKHELKEFCKYLAENACDEEMAEQAKELLLNMGKKNTTAKKVAKTAGAQKATSKKEVKKTPKKEAEKATDKKMSAQKATSKTTENKPSEPKKIAMQAVNIPSTPQKIATQAVNTPSDPKKIAMQAPKKRATGKGRSNGE